MYWSISKAVKFAREQTTKAASVKAWRITTKAGRALQEIARQMAAAKAMRLPQTRRYLRNMAIYALFLRWQRFATISPVFGAYIRA
jgi:hypothetical protein